MALSRRQSIVIEPTMSCRGATRFCYYRPVKHIEIKKIGISWTRMAKKKGLSNGKHSIQVKHGRNDNGNEGNLKELITISSITLLRAKPPLRSQTLKSASLAPSLFCACPTSVLSVVLTWRCGIVFHFSNAAYSSVVIYTSPTPRGNFVSFSFVLF